MVEVNEERHIHTLEYFSSSKLCDSVIKHDCRVGQVLQNPKTLVNNSEENQQSGKTGQDLRVLVLNMRGDPLMPTTPAKARHLLEQDRAKVVSRKPFTIQLKYATGETKQSIILGVDSGYRYIGVSAVSDKKELFSAEIQLRTDVSKKLQERAMYRRTRRSRLWHRKPRFLNRSKLNGWLAPSIRHKLVTHIHLIENIKQLLPITKIVVEVASFNQQKMMNPEIDGVKYQQGELQGYEVREYLLEKWGRKCAYCNKTDVPLEVEHIIPKSRGGTDRVSNLTISCHSCNQKKGNRTAEEFGFPDIQKQARKPLETTAFMNIVRWKLVDLLNCDHTYGSITKYRRIKQGLDKSHVNDAFVIAGGAIQERCRYYVIAQIRRNNRCLQLNRKGFKPSIRRQHYSLQPNDLVQYNNKPCRVKGIHSYGKYIILVNGLLEKINVSIKKVELICYGKGTFTPYYKR